MLSFCLFLLSITAMKEEDLYKLDEYEYHFRLSQGRITTPVKTNKGDFFKAKEPCTGKTIYFLGTLHPLPSLLPFRSTHMIDHVIAKVKDQLKMDDKEKIGSIWLEDEILFKWTDLDGQYANIIGSNAGHKKGLDCVEESKAVMKQLRKAKEKQWCHMSLKEKNAQAESDKIKCNNCAEIFIRGDQYSQLKMHNLDENFFADTTRTFFGGGFGGMTSRNLNWVKKLLDEDQSVQFVIAGAAHLWFKTGVLGLLLGKGWNIEQIDMNLPYPTQFENIFTRTADIIKKYRQLKL